MSARLRMEALGVGEAGTSLASRTDGRHWGRQVVVARASGTNPGSQRCRNRRAWWHVHTAARRRRPSRPFSNRALNFLSADVRNLFGPFINVYLVTGQHWTQTDVGLITTGSGLLGIALQTPIGAAIDVTRAKRAVIVATMAAMTFSALIIYAFPTFWPMTIATSVLSLAGDAFVPAVSALTLGLVARNALARRLGRNSAFDHGGNIAIALVAGGVGYLFSQRVVFLLVPFFAALTSAAVLMIPAAAIDHDRARDLGHVGADDGAAAGWNVLFRTRPLMIFAVSALLFHFANAPLLPLVGQKLALEFPKEATAMLSFCMVAAQGVMLPIAIFVGRNADRLAAGRSSSSPSPCCRFAPRSIRSPITPSGCSACNSSTESERASTRR